MSERVAISKKLRFEVFKRDKFTCQYCGQKAPDVILHVDHINPVSKGGGNDILNLITACSSCNGGKSDRLLGDHVELEKQRGQLEELSERREQLEAMIQWREELIAFNDSVVERLAAYWLARAPGHPLTDTGLALFAKWLRNYGEAEVMDAIDKATTQYLRLEQDTTEGVTTSDSANHAFNMIPRIAATVRKSADKPWLRDCFYIRGILRNRLNYVNERQVIPLIEDAILSGCETEWVKEVAKDARSWTEFSGRLLEAINEINDDSGGAQ